MELRRLRYFLMVAEELHFGRAAERLGLAQPPLSQQIRALEAEIGERLFERTSRRVALTPAGAALLPHVREALGAAAAGLEASRRAARGEGEPLVVAFLHSLAYTLLPRLLPAFRQAHSEIPLVLREMDSAQQVESLAAGQIEIGLLRPPVDHRLVESAPLLSEPFVVAIPSHHKLAKRKRIPVAALNNAPMVLYPPNAGPQGFAHKLAGWFASEGVAPQAVQEARTLHTAVGLVAAGIGIALVPASVAKLGVPGITFRALASQAPEAEVCVAWHRGSKSRSVTAFRSLARRLFVGGRGSNVVEFS